MESIIEHIALAGIAFGRNTLGLVVKPYQTYRSIIDRASAWELVYIAILVFVYFSLASLVKVASFRPFILTKQFVLLAAAASVTYALVVCAAWVVGRHIGGKGTLGGVAVAWGYTLIPTTLWFLATSLLYVMLPPPRTTSVAGITFSIAFLVFSATLFFWKLTLGYLTLRFGLKLDLIRILMVVGVVVPIAGAWSWGMYRLGIFKVPFV